MLPVTHSRFTAIFSRLKLGCWGSKRYYKIKVLLEVFNWQTLSTDVPSRQNVSGTHCRTFQTPSGKMTRTRFHFTLTKMAGLLPSVGAQMRKTLNAIGLTLVVLAVCVLGIFLFVVSLRAIDSHKAEKRKREQAEAEHQRKVDAVAKSVAVAQQKSDARAAEFEAAKSQIKLKDWSFSVTSEYHGIHITDGPVIVIKYELLNPTAYQVKFAEWSMRFSDFNDKEIKSGEWKWPVSDLKGDFILGFNNLQFNPRRVNSMGLSIKDVTLSK